MLGQPRCASIRRRSGHRARGAARTAALLAAAGLAGALVAALLFRGEPGAPPAARRAAVLSNIVDPPGEEPEIPAAATAPAAPPTEGEWESIAASLHAHDPDISPEELEALQSEWRDSQRPDADVLVLQADGKPAGGARVYVVPSGAWDGSRDPDAAWEGRWALDDEPVVTDGAGRCTLSPLEDGVDVVAIQCQRLPGALRNAAAWCRAHPGETIVLRTGEPAQVIAGHVWDESGAPARGWGVAITAPGSIGGDELEDELRCWLPGHPMRGDWTGKDGEFEISGLIDRSYTVVAWEVNGDAYAIAERIPAGSRNVQLFVRSDSLRPVLRGLVVGRNGTPVAGAEISACLSLGGRSVILCKETETDEQGRFELLRAPRHLRLRVWGERIERCEELLAPEDLRDEIRIEVERWAPVVFELAPGFDPPLCLEAVGEEMYFRSEDNEIGWTHLLEVETLPIGIVWLRESVTSARVWRGSIDDWRPFDPNLEIPIHLDPDLAANVVRVGY